LTSVTIGNSVTEIGGAAFGGCDGLTTVICKAITPPSLPESGFSTTAYSNASLYVPAASLQAYQSTEYWSSFANIMSILVGDIDGDGQVTVSDINVIINMMAGMDDGTIDTTIADVDGDGQVTLSDINVIIDIILGK